MESFHGIPNNAFPRSFRDEAQLKFLVVVPHTLIDVVLEYSYEKGFFQIRFELFQKSFHYGFILYKYIKYVKIAL
jgi:hypothetical protein